MYYKYESIKMTSIFHIEVLNGNPSEKLLGLIFNLSWVRNK